MEFLFGNVAVGIHTTRTDPLANRELYIGGSESTTARKHAHISGTTEDLRRLGQLLLQVATLHESLDQQ
jgi:hypothetical protein